MLIFLDEYEDKSFRDIILIERNAVDNKPRFFRISYTYAAYFSLYYVLLFP